MTYRIAYSTNAYTRWSVLSAIQDIRGLGFDGVEILADEPHALPPADPDALRRALRGFPISNLNGNTFRGSFYPSLVDPEASARCARIRYSQEVIDLARSIGAENVCVSSGPAPEGISASEAREFFVDSLRQILEHAETGKPIRIGVECEPGFLIERVNELSAILREIDHPLLGINFDVGHAVCVGEDPAQVVAENAERIWNVHLEDILGRVHEHRIPGHGSIAFETIRVALDRYGYDRFLTLEIYPYKDCPSEAGIEGLAFLRKIF